MGAIGPILLGLQMVSNIASTRQEYKAQQRAYEAQAQTARQNAAIAERQRSQQADAYAQKQAQLNDRMRLARGQAAAAAGAGGFTAEGSVNDILESSYDAYQKDSMNLLSQQRNDSWSQYVNQVNYLNQANAYDTAARNVRKQGHQKIFGTLLGTAAMAYGKLKNYQFVVNGILLMICPVLYCAYKFGAEPEAAQVVFLVFIPKH